MKYLCLIYIDEDKLEPHTKPELVRSCAWAKLSGHAVVGRRIIKQAA